MTPDVIERLAAALAALPSELVATPPAERLGAALVIVEPRDDGETTIVYTRRRDDLRSHPGQISFPGGRVDPGETVEQAAIREAHEEVALDPEAVEVIGRLPGFFIPPSRFWLQAVVAHWVAPHDLVPAEAEVAAVLHVGLSRLRDREAWRTVRLTSSGWSWAWDLGDGHLLWGATGALTAVLLGLLDPDWSGGVAPADLRDREVRPWEGERRVGEQWAPPRLSDVEEMAADDAVEDRAVVATAARLEAAGAVVADAAAALARGGRRAVVLAGAGATGEIGRVAARRLADAGMDVSVISVDGDASRVPPSDVLIDALVGRGLRGPLRDPALALVHAMRLREQPVVAVDVPSGVDPRRGIVGDAVAADVTVAVDVVQPGLLLPGLAPFVGDLYVATLDGGAPHVTRAVGTAATWRE